MTQHNLTQILKVIRDLVMRNRPCYRDYLGSETVTKTVQIGAGTFASSKGFVIAEFPATDPTFTGFILGETYTVTIDGVTADYVAHNFSPLSDEFGPIIGTVTTFNMEDNTFDGWLAAAVIDIDSVLCAAETLDTPFVGKTISISQTRTETVKRYNTKLLPEYLLPAFLRKNVVATTTEVQSVQSTADNAQSTADNAQSTANTAKSTAEAAQTTANAAQATANNAQAAASTAKSTADEAKTKAINAYTKASIAETTADGCVKKSNTRQFSINLGSYNAFSGSVESSRVNYSFMENDVTDTPINLNIGALGGTALKISVTPSTSPTVKIIPPVYSTQQADIEFSRASSVYPHPKIKGIGGIVMHSSTSGSTKQFLITVDDTGTLKATEVT